MASPFPTKIKRRTAIVSMLVLGSLAIIFGIRGLIVDITASVWGIVGLAIGAILVLEVGLKKVTKLSSLKNLKTQQYISLVVAGIVILVSIFLLFEVEIPILFQIANGSFIVGGIFVFLEALTFK